jgi:hypothetical protein
MRLQGWEWIIILLLFSGVVNLALSFVLARVARNRGKSYGAYLVFSIFFGCLIPAIVLALSSNANVLRPCPRCGAGIALNARFCGFCQLPLSN